MQSSSENPKKPDEESSANPRKGFAGKQWLSMGQLAGSGMELGLTVAVLTLIGWWLDSKWNSSPWMLLTGAFIGTIGSMYKLWRINAKWFGKDKKN